MTSAPILRRFSRLLVEAAAILAVTSPTTYFTLDVAPQDRMIERLLALCALKALCEKDRLDVLLNGWGGDAAQEMAQ